MNSPKFKHHESGKLPHKDSNTEVFVLSPDLLQQLGIDLNNINNVQENSTEKTDSYFAEKIYSNVNDKNIDNTNAAEEASILKTADLMKTSVFLSPTFATTANDSLDSEIEVPDMKMVRNNIMPNLFSTGAQKHCYIDRDTMEKSKNITTVDNVSPLVDAQIECVSNSVVLDVAIVRNELKHHEQSMPIENICQSLKLLTSDTFIEYEQEPTVHKYPNKDYSECSRSQNVTNCTKNANKKINILSEEILNPLQIKEITSHTLTSQFIPVSVDTLISPRSHRWDTSIVIPLESTKISNNVEEVLNVEPDLIHNERDVTSAAITDCVNIMSLTSMHYEFVERVDHEKSDFIGPKISNKDEITSLSKAVGEVDSSVNDCFNCVTKLKNSSIDNNKITQRSVNEGSSMNIIKLVNGDNDLEGIIQKQENNIQLENEQLVTHIPVLTDNNSLAPSLNSAIVSQDNIVMNGDIKSDNISELNIQINSQEHLTDIAKVVTSDTTNTVLLHATKTYIKFKDISSMKNAVNAIDVDGKVKSDRNSNNVVKKRKSLANLININNNCEESLQKEEVMALAEVFKKGQLESESVKDYLGLNQLEALNSKDVHKESFEKCNANILNHKIREIATYLSQSKKFSNSSKSIANNKYKKIIRNETKNSIVTSKLCVQGTEKPGGNEKNSKSERSCIVHKTYNRKRKVIIPNSNLKEDTVTEMKQKALLNASKDIDIETSSITSNSNLKIEEYCLCDDFGRLSFYDEICDYEHVHFCTHKNIGIDPQLLFTIYNDYNCLLNMKENNKDSTICEDTDTNEMTSHSICWNDLVYELQESKKGTDSCPLLKNLSRNVSSKQTDVASHSISNVSASSTDIENAACSETTQSKPTDNTLQNKIDHSFEIKTDAKKRVTHKDNIFEDNSSTPEINMNQENKNMSLLVEIKKEAKNLDKQQKENSSSEDEKPFISRVQKLRENKNMSLSPKVPKRKSGVTHIDNIFEDNSSIPGIQINQEDKNMSLVVEMPKEAKKSDVKQKENASSEDIILDEQPTSKVERVRKNNNMSLLPKVPKRKSGVRHKYNISEYDPSTPGKQINQEDKNLSLLVELPKEAKKSGTRHKDNIAEDDPSTAGLQLNEKDKNMSLLVEMPKKVKKSYGKQKENTSSEDIVHEKPSTSRLQNTSHLDDKVLRRKSDVRHKDNISEDDPSTPEEKNMSLLVEMPKKAKKSGVRHKHNISKDDPSTPKIQLNKGDKNPKKAKKRRRTSARASNEDEPELKKIRRKSKTSAPKKDELESKTNFDADASVVLTEGNIDQKDISSVEPVKYQTNSDADNVGSVTLFDGNTDLKGKNRSSVKPVIRRTKSNDIAEDNVAAVEEKSDDEDENVSLVELKKRRESHDKKKVTCGVCSEEVENAKWIVHLSKRHNYLAWKQGEPKLDLDDELQVNSYLTDLAKKLDGLLCSFCGLKRKYGKSFMTHVNSCSFNEGNAIMSLSDNSGSDTDMVASTPSNQENSIPKDEKGQVKCGVCAETVESRNWLEHIGNSHDYVAWAEGERALDVNDDDMVYKHMHNLRKKLTYFKCSRCGLQRNYAKTFLQHMKVCTVEKISIKEEPGVKASSADSVICAICRKELPADRMANHSMNKHYNLAWPVGGKPIDIRTAYVVERHIKEYLKKYKTLVCKVCGISRASCLGFYAHIAVCGKTEEEVHEVKNHCKICNKSYLYIYENSHMKGHRDGAHNANAVKKELDIKTEEEDNSNVALGRRKAAVKAIDVIAKVASGDAKYKCQKCGFDAGGKRELETHQCTDAFDSGSDAALDLDAESESGTDSGEDMVDVSDEEPDRKKRFKPCISMNVRKNIPYQVKDPKRYLLKSGEEFIKFHFTDEVLFPDWHPRVASLSCERYLPPLEESCKVKVGDDDWQSVKRFHVKKIPAGWLIFGGACVQDVQWAPLGPASDAGRRAYLALLAHAGCDAPRLTADAPVSARAMLQIWDYGDFQRPPKFAMGLMHDCGVVWAMSWCPSGGRAGAGADPGAGTDPGADSGAASQLAPAATRLGLLAVASSNGSAYIFSVPYPDTNASEPEFYKMEPLVELRLWTSTERQIYQATSINWSPERGHQTVVVGYGDGTVAYYDLGTDSPLLRERSPAGDVLRPFHDERPIRAAVLELTTYPRATPSHPLGVVCSASAAGAALRASGRALSVAAVAVAAARFVPLWPAVVLAREDVTSVPDELDASGVGRRWGLSRALAACARCGAVAGDAAPLLRLATAHPVLKEVKKAVIGTLQMIPLSKKRKTLADDNLATKVEPSTYDEAIKKYGIEFKLDSRLSGPNGVREVAPDRFPLGDVTAMAFCPTPTHAHKLAVATHAGLVFMIGL